MLRMGRESRLLLLLSTTPLPLPLPPSPFPLPFLLLGDLDLGFGLLIPPPPLPTRIPTPLSLLLSRTQPQPLHHSPRDPLSSSFLISHPRRAQLALPLPLPRHGAAGVKTPSRAKRTGSRGRGGRWCSGRRRRARTEQVVVPEGCFGGRVGVGRLRSGGELRMWTSDGGVGVGRVGVTVGIESCSKRAGGRRSGGRRAMGMRWRRRGSGRYWRIASSCWWSRIGVIRVSGGGGGGGRRRTVARVAHRGGGSHMPLGPLGLVVD